MTNRVGQQLGNYRLVRLLGSGGFAQVYLGQHVLLDMQAAVKVLNAQLSDREVERFCAEVRTISRLAHVHIVRLLEFDVAEGTPFLVMEYASNGTLRQRYPRGTRLDLNTILPFIKQAADALQYAHEEKLIHRDVKPENLLLGERDRLLLSDFGVAVVAHSSRSLTTQDVLGTVAYMAPEQLQGKPRPASDQYALGAVVYEWLSGEQLFHGSAIEIAAQHMLAAPPSLLMRVPTLAPAVDAVVLRALAKDPRARFASVQELAAALEHACQGDAVPRISRRWLSIVGQVPHLTRSSRRSSVRADTDLRANTGLPSAATFANTSVHPTSPPAAPSTLLPNQEPAEGIHRPSRGRFLYLGGRRYLANAPYALPKDLQEVNRLDFQHFFVRHALRGNYLSPITEPRRILDVGCGTGRWAMEMAARFPQATVIGIDLVLPDDFASLGHGLPQRPGNVVFQEGDVTKGLAFADASFDFVFMRFLFMGIPAHDWPGVISELVRITRSGGWVESFEALRIGSERSPAMKVIIEWGNELLKRRGLDPCIVLRIPEMMRASGLVQITTRELPKEAQTRHGRSSRKASGLATIEQLKPQIIEQGIAGREEYDRVTAQAQVELEQDKEPRGFPSFVTFGQRL